MGKNFLLILLVAIVLMIIVLFFLSKSESNPNEFVIEKGSGEKVKIKGISDLDDRFVDKAMGNIKS